MSSKNEWLEWRRQGLGSSDAPVIMGHYDYCTPYQLWEQKTGKIQDNDKSSFIMNKGNEMEPIARARYELETGLNMPAMRCQHVEFEFLRATMDGFSNKQGIEIKYVGKNHKTIPPKHYAQVQHQLIVTGAKWIDYVTITDDKTIKINKIKPDQKYIMDYLQRAVRFWQLVVSDTPPDLVDQDVRIVKGHEDVVKRYVDVKKKIDELSKDLEAIKETIFDLAKNNVKSKIGELIVTKTHRIGSIDYSKIDVLKDIDLEPYRKKSSVYFKISEGA